MGKKANEKGEQLNLALGARFVEALMESPSSEVRALATSPDAMKILDAVQYVMDEQSLPNFLHSAMCAMSLPVRRPKDEMAPIIRRDGNYSLIIQPLTRMEPVGPDGEFVPVTRGVPFGRHARLVLLFIMTEAVRTRSREIYLGKDFSAWLRRMGIMSTDSAGPKSSRSLVQEQVDRLMSCEWTMRWDERAAGEGRGKRKGVGKGATEVAMLKPEPEPISAFAVNDMKLVNQYAGMRTAEGSFISHFVLSQAFYDNLIEHSVPLNDRAIVALQKSATQLDLYTWLAYRLPRIEKGTEVRIKWTDLANHLGNETAELFKFRQTVRTAWETVSGVYQQARHSVDLGQLIIRLRYADPPTKRHMVIENPKAVAEPTVTNTRKARSGLLAFVDVLPGGGHSGQPDLPLPAADFDPAADSVRFPSTDHLKYACSRLYDIGCRHGSGNDVSIMAGAFRKKLGSELATLHGERLLNRWRQYCEKWPKPS